MRSPLGLASLRVGRLAATGLRGRREGATFRAPHHLGGVVGAVVADPAVRVRSAARRGARWRRRPGRVVGSARGAARGGVRARGAAAARSTDCAAKPTRWSRTASRSSARSANDCASPAPARRSCACPDPRPQAPGFLDESGRVGESRGVRQELQAELEGILRRLLDAAGDTGPLPEFTLETPRRRTTATSRATRRSCSASGCAARRARSRTRSPTRLRERTGLVARVEVAGPGFLNVWLAGSRWQELLRRVLARASATGAERQVPAGACRSSSCPPIRPVRSRSATAARPCSATPSRACSRRQGYDVTREYYFNDGGRQMRMLGESVSARYLEQLGRAAPPPDEALADPEHRWVETRDGLPVVFPRDGYQGELHRRDRRATCCASAARRSSTSPATASSARSPRRASSPRSARRSTRSASASTSTPTRRTSTSGRLVAACSTACARRTSSTTKDGATWLRATARGLERDRVLVKRSGEPTYLLPDIAYHREKFRRGFDHVIDVQGADHIEQFPFVVEARRGARLPDGPHRAGDAPVRDADARRRAGEAVHAPRHLRHRRRAAREVGADVFRFFMVQRRAESHLDFDLDLAKSTDWKKNPAYYVQYAHARTCGIERKAPRAGRRAARRRERRWPTRWCCPRRSRS